MNTSLFRIIFSLLIAPVLAHAQIYNCDGIVTNKPCESGVPVMEEKASQKPDPKVMAEARRSLWLENLDLARSKVSREFGVAIDITPTRDQCMTSTLDECRRAISEKEKDINQLIIEAKKKGEADKSVKPSNEDAANQTVITIINDHDDDLILNRRRPWNSSGPSSYGPHLPRRPSEPHRPYQPHDRPRPSHPAYNDRRGSSSQPVFNPETGQVYDQGVAPGIPDSSPPQLGPPRRR